MIFDVCNVFFFFFSLSSIGEGAVIVAGFGFRRSREILVGRASFFVGACRGKGEEKFLVHIAERRREGKRKRGLSTY